MAEEDRRAKLVSKMRELDKEQPSVSDRAQKVYQAILACEGEFSNWDLVCFATEYLGSMVAVLPWILEPVKEISRLVYSQHYLLSGPIYDEKPTRENEDAEKQED